MRFFSQTALAVVAIADAPLCVQELTRLRRRPIKAGTFTLSLLNFVRCTLCVGTSYLVQRTTFGGPHLEPSDLYLLLREEIGSYRLSR
jgi:hypothetical protein